MTQLQPNAVFTYEQSVANADGTVTLNLICAHPGDSLPGSYQMVLSAANVTTINSAVGNAAKKAALDAIVQAYMVATYRVTTAIQSSLDLLVGMTVTVA